MHTLQSIFVSSEYLARLTMMSEHASEYSIRSSHLRMGSIRGHTIAAPMHGASNDEYGDDRLEYTRGGAQRKTVFDNPDPSHSSKVSCCKTFWEHVKRTWKYNGRQMIFFATICVCTLAMVPVIVFSYGTNYDYYVGGTEDFIECLLDSAGNHQGTSQEEVDWYAKEHCGSVPSVRPDQALVRTNYLYMILFITFNVNG